MKSAVVTGSISRRSRPSVRRWMRASRRRLHHSSLASRRRELAAQDLAFGFELRQRLIHQVARQRQIARQLRRASAGRSHSSQPRRISAAQPRGFGHRARRAAALDRRIDRASG